MPSVSRLGLLVPDKKISHPTHEICRNASLQRAGSSNATGGVYEYIVPGVGTKKLYCDLETDGANWIVSRQRVRAVFRVPLIYNQRRAKYSLSVQGTSIAVLTLSYTQWQAKVVIVIPCHNFFT